MVSAVVAIPEPVQSRLVSDSQAPAFLDPFCFLTQSIESRATSFLLSSYVLGSHFEYLPSLYSRTNMDQHLSESILAVALVSFSNQFNCHGAMKDARRQYVSALRMTNLALQSNQNATKDSTLIAVLLLSLFEMITYSKRQPVKSWTSHIEGATALIRLRGRQQFSTPLGFQLFIQMTYNITVQCMQFEIALPADIAALKTYAGNFVDRSDPGWTLSEINERFAKFRGDVKDGTIFDSNKIVAMARQLDEELALWASTVKPQWQYECIYTDSSEPSVYEGYCHGYVNHRLAQMWNTFRMGRIILNQLVHDHIVLCMSSTQTDCPSQYQRTVYQLSMQNLVEMSSDICATVPQFTLGPLQKPTPSTSSRDLTPRTSPGTSTSRTTSPEIESEPLSPATYSSGYTSLRRDRTSAHRVWISEPTDIYVANCYFLMWPLVMAAALATSVGPRRDWIIDRLRYIGNYKRNPQALIAADSLERGDKVHDWYVVYSTWMEMQLANYVRQASYVSRVLMLLNIYLRSPSTQSAVREAVFQ